MQSGWFTGIKLAGLEFASYVEATALASIIVVVLVVSAKSAGAALRALTALKEEDYSFAAASIRALRRQMFTVLFVAGVIAGSIVTFLSMARTGAPALVAERLAIADTTRMKAEQEQRIIREAGQEREADVSDADVKAQEARIEVSRQQDLLAFAKTVEKNNNGMLFLNLALVGAGILIGFLRDSRDLTETIGEDADIVRLKQKCLTTREQVRRLTERARTHLTSADAAYARTNSLLRSDPLATLDAKRATLNGIIPTWREVNARMRRIDPSNIVAFQQPFLPSLIEIRNSVMLQKPETFGRTMNELERLRGDINRVERIADAPIVLVA